MIAATIGRTFLKAYNKKHKKEINVKQFFEEVYVKAFFDHPKYMMSGGNSPLENPKISWKKGVTPSPEERKERIAKTITKLDSNEFDASIAIGFPASEQKDFQTTSGLVTDIDLPFSIEDKYYTWIGSGFGVCVKGGLSLYFNEPEILLTIYDGWAVYREILNDKSLSKIRGNQIEAWNAQWLNFSFDDRIYREDYDFAYLHNIESFTVNENVIEVKTINWNKLFFSISSFVDKSSISVYVYNLGQTNTTIGFIPFHFESGLKIKNFYKKLFGENAALQQAKDYENLFGLELKKACTYGVIGLHALEPQKLRDKYRNFTNLNLIKPKVNPKKGETEEAFDERKNKAYQKDYENIIYYQTYKTWLLAMITKNKEESLEYTKEVAEALHAYRNRAKKLDRINLIQNDLLVAKSKKAFIDALATIVEDTKKDIAEHDLNDSELSVYKTLRDRVHMMNSEDFGYFVVLLKFDFAYVVRELNN
jgi:hypothetical protein